MDRVTVFGQTVAVWPPRTPVLHLRARCGRALAGILAVRSVFEEVEHGGIKRLGDLGIRPMPDIREDTDFY